jgi:hypothetical protein
MPRPLDDAFVKDVVPTSDGKSLIVEEQLYSFFFAFFPQKSESSFFRFSSSTQY